MLERTSPATNAANFEAFRRGLRELGYVEGKNLVIEYRSADGRDERFAALATELVRLNVDLILTRGTPAALAAKNATGTIPVVITGLADPVGQGIVASLARPGGNITGVSAIVTELYAKRVEILKRAASESLPNRGPPATWATPRFRRHGKRSRRRRDPSASSRSFSTCESLRIWGRHSMARQAACRRARRGA